MSPHSLLLPALALIGWTLLILLLIPYRRFRAVQAGLLGPGDFRLGESARVPAAVCLPNRNYMNLLEAPVLFYAVTLMLYVTGQGDALAVALAWGYVGLRVLHSLVHVSYNHVLHRLTLFAASNVVLLVLWGRLLQALLRSA